MYSAFLQELQAMPVADKMEVFIATLDSDHSGWVCIDGEEGDHGVIVYRHGGVEVCRIVSTGGDNDNYEFTASGRALLFSKMFEACEIDTEISVNGAAESLREKQ